VDGEPVTATASAALTVAGASATCTTASSSATWPVDVVTCSPTPRSPSSVGTCSTAGPVASS
jgi:hypothetical protein